MPQHKDRQYRSISPLTPLEREEFFVEGYATTWNRYLLYELDDGPIYEQFLKGAFENCDMNDIILQYNHEGKVYARTSNKTLEVKVDGKGLFVRADLSKSTSAKELYEEIDSGLITKMSWGFIPGEYNFDRKTRTIIHTKIKKIYDVSAVSMPANENTEIQARSFANFVFSDVLKEQYEKERLLLKLELEGVL